jgi:hypothetical protein
MPQFNGKQEAKPCHTAKPTCAAPATVSGRISSSKFRPIIEATGRATKQRGWEGDGSAPPARIPANTVAALFKKGAAVTPNVLAGKPVRVLNVGYPS